jgi:hypothetical protein
MFIKKGSIIVIGCAMFFGSVNAPGAARYEPPNKPVFAHSGKKGDRLPMASATRAHSSLPYTKPASTKRPPLGCDPMFSPIADPAHASLYRRCMV